MYYDENEDEVERLRSRRSRPAPRPRTSTSCNQEKQQGSYEKGSENDYLFAEAEGGQIQVPFTRAEGQQVRKKPGSSGSNRARSTARSKPHSGPRKNTSTGKANRKSTISKSCCWQYWPYSFFTRAGCFYINLPGCGRLLYLALTVGTEIQRRR